MESFGIGLRPGERHYRAYVGPPEDYDLVGALQFTLLFAAGLRETDRVLDVGCGSLRAGRLLIPYLRPGHYVGVEPNSWLVDEAIERELGESILETKRPRFLADADFGFAAAGDGFEFVLAHSILSHTYPDLARRLFAGVARAVARDGVFVGTWVAGHTDGDGSGWVYPGCVRYPLPDILAMASQADMAAAPLAWPHPRQRWFVASPSPAVASAVAERVSEGALPWPLDRPRASAGGGS